MKNNYIKQIILITSILLSVGVYAQKKQIKNSTKNTHSKISYQLTPENKRAIQETGYVRCLTVENEIALQQKYPSRYNTKQFEDWLNPKISELKAKRKSNIGAKTTVIYNIPVVIHIIHNGDPINTVGNIVGENISDAQAASQIEIMNQDFRRMMNTPGGANSTRLAVDVEINFCLAKQDENGEPTTGIIRHNIAPYTNSETDGVGGADWEKRADVELMKTNTQWDPTKYLNMWTFRPGGKDLDDGGLNGLLGYAQFPSSSGLSGINTIGGQASTDGVVAGFDVFGSSAFDDGSFTMNNTYNLGRTMTHEVGHWLGLRHIWGDKTNDTDDGCTFDDYCNDTPNAEDANYNCNLTKDSCPETLPDPTVYDMVQNYMDYTNDACMDTFTSDQKDRMITVMQNSPRRKELNSSSGCTEPVPAIYFNNSGSSLIENTSCGYTDISIDLSIAKAPNSDATITFSKTGGTLTEGVDFDFVNSSVVFLNGETTSKTLTVRIYEDSFDETDEILIIGMSLSTTGDAVITTISNAVFNLILLNDDQRDTGLTTIFNEDFESYADFEIGSIRGWTMNDVDGNSTYGIENTTFTNQGYTGTFIAFNASQTTPSSSPNWDSHGGEKGYYCFAATDSPSGTAKNNDYIFTPQLNLNGTGSELKFWARSINDDYGLERFNVLVSTTDTNITSFSRISPSVPSAGTTFETAPTVWTEYTYDLSAFDGQQIYIAYNVISKDAYAFMLDDVSVTTTVNLNVQTEINTADQNALTSAGTVFANNNLNNNLVVDITNVDGKNYGCVNANVSRAFDANNPAVQEQASGIANYVLSKSFTITPSVAQNNGNASLKFYFTEEEIAAWELATGNSRNELIAIKKVGTTREAGIATLGTFNGHITLATEYTSGINGTYHFGKSTVLKVKDSDFVLFNIYPNPTSNNINISLSTSEDVNIKIHDLIGRNMFDKTYINTSNMFSKNIDLNLTKGIYILTVESGDKIAVKKIMIN